MSKSQATHSKKKGPSTRPPPRLMAPRDFLRKSSVHLDHRIRMARERWDKRLIQLRHQREAQAVLETLGQRNTLFYPGSGLDWAPLRLLTSVCDTFVFCDAPRPSLDLIGGNQFRGLHCEVLVDLDTDTVRGLSDNEVPRFPWRIEGKYGQPWGKYARLTSNTRRPRASIHLFYFGIEGITAFFNLFVARSAVPKVICLKGNGGLWGDREHIHDWNAPFGKLVQRCQPLPTHLILNGEPQPGWPHTVFWRHFVNWRGRPNGYMMRD